MALNDIQKVLTKEFPKDKIQWKPKGGKSLGYISHGLITERLNQADPEWSTYMVSEHIYHDAQGRPHCAGVTIGLTVGGATRVETGGPQNITGEGKFPYNFADEIKNAYSDALKRAAMRFGVALSMWEDLIDAEGDEDVYPNNGATTAPPSRVQAAQQVFDAEPVSREVIVDKSAGIDNRTPELKEGQKKWAEGGDTRERTPGGATVKSRNYALVLCGEKGAGMTNDERHQMIYSMFGHESLDDLNQAQMKQFIDHVKPLAEGGEPAPAPTSKVPDTTPSVNDWTSFYKLARPHGISNRKAFEELVGIDMPGTVDDAVYALQSYLDAKEGSS